MLKKINYAVLFFLIYLPFVLQAEVPFENWYRYEGEYKGEKFAISFPKAPTIEQTIDGSFALKYCEEGSEFTFNIIDHQHSLPAGVNIKLKLFDNVLSNLGKRIDGDIDEVHLFSVNGKDILEFYATTKEEPKIKGMSLIITKSNTYSLAVQSNTDNRKDFIHSLTIIED